MFKKYSIYSKNLKEYSLYCTLESIKRMTTSTSLDNKRNIQKLLYDNENDNKKVKGKMYKFKIISNFGLLDAFIFLSISGTTYILYKNFKWI